MKQRADIALTRRGLAPSRERAQALIIAGRVYIGEQKVGKASDPVTQEDELSVRGEDEGWASRGAHKLVKALDRFSVDVSGLTALDIGAASGGFTDVLLRRGARHVYAVDVGYGQLDWRLRKDPRVSVMERTNARAITPQMFDLTPSLTVMDVSFISIRLIIPAAALVMGEQGRFVLLVKPQFEAGRALVGKHGVVRDPETHEGVLREIRDFAAGIGWGIQAIDYSPIKGPKGNMEFLADIKKGALSVSDQHITELVKIAHGDLNRAE